MGSASNTLATRTGTRIKRTTTRMTVGADQDGNNRQRAPQLR